MIKFSVQMYDNIVTATLLDLFGHHKRANSYQMIALTLGTIRTAILDHMVILLSVIQLSCGHCTLQPYVRFVFRFRVPF